ncbi:hypothetical protein RA210_U610002 [Rubrivivax sp. A210]|nr:hypothetical protein RA210_U610002 [Rubrivivax sp. A210]
MGYCRGTDERKHCEYKKIVSHAA